MKAIRSKDGLPQCMRVLALIILMIAIVVPSAGGAAQSPAQAGGAYYYYVDGIRRELSPSLEWVSVQFASDDPAAQTEALRPFSPDLGSLTQSLTIPNPPLTLLPLEAGMTGTELAGSIQAMSASPAFAQVNPVFDTGDALMAMTNEFVATFPAGMSSDAIGSVNATHAVEVVKPILGQENTFVLRLLPGAEMDVLAMANLYQEQGLAVYSAPNFLRLVDHEPAGTSPKSDIGPMAPANDAMYSDQWALNNTGYYGNPADVDIDAPEAWDLTTGKASVIIAVIDEGVDLFHEDLAGKLVPGYDATGGGSAGGPWGDDAHGTLVAGLAAAATNNSIGVAGVCQFCTIMPIRIAYDSGGHWVTYDSWIADAISWAYQHGAWILNNSWGGGVPSTVINTAFANAKILGRAGKGSVVLVAAGNAGSPTVSYPASLDYVMAVGASNMCDERKTSADTSCNGYETNWGSNYGSALDISAPGVWLDSTDIMGLAGVSVGNYTGVMNGTSGATPIVAGVAGLILSRNSGLTASQVETLLKISADDVNGGGWDSGMGFGRVNAYEAVRLANSIPVVVYAGAEIQGRYPMGFAQSARVSYTGLNNGPITIKSPFGTPIIASERVAYFNGTAWTNFSELMGLPSNQLTTSYVLPWYNNAELNTQLRFGNVGSAGTNVKVTVGGVVQGVYYLAPNQSTRVSYIGLNNGPVKIESSGGVPIIASERVAYFDGSNWTDFSELMGLPSNRLTTSYVMPWYNNAELNTQLRFGNVGTAATIVTVKVGGVVQGNYYLAPNQSTRVSYAGLNSGPVVITSSGGVPIIASERVAYFNGSSWTNFSELMGLPSNQLTTSYVMPWYNNAELNTQLRFGNVGTANTIVTIKVGGVTQGTYFLTPSQSVRVSYAGLNNGPVKVTSSGGVPIVASIRVAYTPDGGVTWPSFSELMALPSSQLYSSYVLPWYNNAELNTQVRFGIP